MNEEAVRAILVAAHRAVDNVDVPAELRSVAFREAVRLLAGEPSSSSTGSTTSTTSPPPAGTGPGKSIEAVAAKLGSPVAVVGECFHLEGDELSISLAPAKFKAQKSAATKQLALLIAASRQAGGWDSEWTTSKAIREVVDDYGKFDSGNFATTLTSMSDVFGFSGTGPGRKVKVNREGYQQAAALINELTGAQK